MSELETPRLRMRRWRESDREPFAALNSDPAVMEHFPAPVERHASDASIDAFEAQFAERGWSNWAVEVRDTGDFAGFVGLGIPRRVLPFSPCVEIGWRLARAYWGKGYATEAARASLQMGFETLALPEIVAFTAIGNRRSRAVMERIGMLDAHQDFEHPGVPEGHPLRKHCLYRMRREDWLRARELAAITAGTLAHYERSAVDFREGTRGHDVSQNIAALLRHMRGTAPFSILDFGCGPGRDLAALRALGHEPVGLEGSASFVAMARAHSNCEVWQQDFLALRLPAERFDGIFANASLFHVPAKELPRVLGELRGALKPGGVLFSSNPRGDNDEGWNRGRYGAYHDLETWRAFLESAGFVELEHYYRPPGLPREQQPWIASVWRKQG